VDAPYRHHSCTLFTGNVYLKSKRASQVNSIVGYFNCEYVFQRETSLRTRSRNFLPFITTQGRNFLPFVTTFLQKSKVISVGVVSEMTTNLNAYQKAKK
jgi:hypothetical protein